MSTPDRIATLAVSCCALLILGCQDEQAKRRAEVQQAIASAGAEIQKINAVLSDPQKVDNVRQELNQIIITLNNTGDGGVGQRAAAAQLAAGVHRRLASLAEADAMKLEARQQARRTVLLGMIDAADQLDVMATTLEAMDTRQADARLVSARNDSEHTLAGHSRRLAELDGPIARLNTANRADQQEADRLREDASRLRREAAGLGPAAGYGAFEEALRLDRQADGVEYDLAHRELDLRYNYESEHAIVQTTADRLGDEIASIEDARQTLKQLDASVLQEAATTRSRLAELRDSIEAGLIELQESSAPLAEFYDRATLELDRAATKARAAAGLGTDSVKDAARIEAAHAYQELAGVHRTRARGLQCDVDLFQRLSETTGSAGTSIDDLAEAFRQQVSQSVTAYENAGRELGMVSGKTGRRQLEALRATIIRLKTAAASQTIERRTTAAGPADPAAGRATPRAAADADADADDTTSPNGAESPQALLAALRGCEDYAALADLLTRLTYIRSDWPDVRRLYETLTLANLGAIELEQALRDTFGTGLRDMEGVAPMDGDTLFGQWLDAELELDEVWQNTATIVVTDSAGGTERIPLIVIDGRWFRDGTELFELVVEQMITGPDSEKYVESLGTGLRELARRVKAGEFSTFQDAVTALAQALRPGDGS